MALPDASILRPPALRALLALVLSALLFLLQGWRGFELQDEGFF